VTVPVVAGFLLFYCGFFRPTQQAIDQQQEDLRVKQAAIAAAASLPEEMQATQAELASTRAFVAEWKAAERHNVAAAFAQLAAGVAAAGGERIKIEPEPPRRYRCLQRVPVKLSFTGTFAQVYQFVRHLEGMPQTIWIEDLDVRQQSQDSPRVTCELRLAIFAGRANSADKVD